MQPSPLKLDLITTQCSSLELQFFVELNDKVRRELSAIGSREGEEDDRVIFHEDYTQNNQKLHSWAEVRLSREESEESEVIVEYLTEGELEDQVEIYKTDFTPAHLFATLQSLKKPVQASFALRFDLGPTAQSRFLRLMPYNAGINGGLAVEYRGAHVQIRTPEGDAFDLWYDVLPDDTMEATVRFTMTEPPTADLPRRGLEFGARALARVVGGAH
ncbi:MAG: hypothetical protein FJ039_06395 [Chloroflexi bacterium]|nr:hypothetical protein [Chloroflexota bacterium]